MRSVIVVLLACAAAILLAGSGRAQPAPDLDRARTLYTSAEKAMADNRLDEALRDYKAAYEVSRDPALLYKVGVAYQKINACRFAASYFVAYLKIGKPSPDFFALTRERIRACGYDPDAMPADLEDPTHAASAGSGAGSGVTTAGSGSAVTAGSDAGSAAPAVDAGSAAPKPPRAKHRGAWILVGSAIAAATVGAVLAYSANAAESDVNDLYVGLGGEPPAFNDATRDRFDDLVAEGKRYQTLSWISFGVAGVLGGLAAWRFTVKEQTVEVTPTATPTGAGVRASWKF